MSLPVDEYLHSRRNTNSVEKIRKAGADAIVSPDFTGGAFVVEAGHTVVAIATPGGRKQLEEILGWI